MRIADAHIVFERHLRSSACNTSRNPKYLSSGSWRLQCSGVLKGSHVFDVVDDP
jgi:hypothetical protein